MPNLHKQRCRYNLLLKIEYVGRTMYDCAGTTPPNPATNPICMVVPPGGLKDKLHLQARLPSPYAILCSAACVVRPVRC